MILKKVYFNIQKFSYSCFKTLSSRSFASPFKSYALMKQDISFYDIRLQKHLNFIKNISLLDYRTENDLIRSHGFSFQNLQLIQDGLRTIDTLAAEIEDIELLIADTKAEDKDLHDEAARLKDDIVEKLIRIKNQVLRVIVPTHPVDDLDIIMELAAGVGGQEAMLFTKDMFKMYCNFACYKGWSYDVIKYDGTELGGLRSAHLSVRGSGAFRTLRSESGVHRVQRVPRTEKTGRTHTSTATVAVLPQPSEIEIVISPSDIEVETKRSSGAGGQHVNKTDSCVRIKHKATGIVTECQMERNQHQNRALALRALRAKLYERELAAVARETSSARRRQVGSAERSEKIRTYNFVRDRVTDHRAHLTAHGIEALLEGGGELERLSGAIEEWNNLQLLCGILEKYDAE